MVLALQGIVSRYPDRSRKRFKLEPEFSARRAPLQVRFKEFKTLIGAVNINDYLDNLYLNKVEVPYEELSRNADRGVSFLFGACVAIAAEDWYSGRSFARRAVELLSGQSESQYEAYYCWALAHRFSVESYEAVKWTRTLLSKCEKFHLEGGHKFRRIRAKTEHGAIIRVFLYKSELLSGFDPGVCPSVTELWRDAWEQLIDAADSLDSLDSLDSIRTRPRSNRHERLSLQVYTNLAALAIFAKWYSSDPSGIPNEQQFMEISQELKTQIDQWNKLRINDPKMTMVPYTIRVFSGVLSFIVAVSDHERERAARETRALLDKLLQVQLELPDFDRAEYKDFLARLPAP